MYSEYLEWVWLAYSELKGLCNKNYCGISKGLINLLAVLEITTVEEKKAILVIICLYL